MPKTLEERLREREFGANSARIFQKAEDKRAIALAVADYLQDYFALSSLELQKSVEKVAGEEGRLVIVKNNPHLFGHLFGEYCRATPKALANTYLARSNFFNYLHIHEAIDKVMNLEGKYQIIIRSGLNDERPGKRGNMKGNTLIYFTTEERLREYFSTRIKPVGMTISYLFNENGLELKK